MVNNLKVRIRGIYSTALTKLLGERGFDIASPTKIINQRTGTEENNDSADVLIYDKEDMNGVTISGIGADRIVNELRNIFFDIATRKIENGTIYVGKIKKIDNETKNIIIDLGNNDEGILSLHNYWGFLRENEKILVQVKGIIKGIKLLSTKLRLFGNNLILIKDGFTKISKHIRTIEEQQRLRRLGENLKLNEWGILWKALAEGKPDAELIDEIKKLETEEKQIKEKFDNSAEPCLLKEGFCTYFVEFSAISKQQMDKIRNDTTHTIVGHHFLKSGGYTLLTEFAEAFDGIDNNIVVDRLNKVLRNAGPRSQASYEIIHKKPGGKDIIMKGIVEKADENEIVIKRRLTEGKRLDGLGGQINEGDYAITKFKPNDWKVIHKYFDANGYPKGVYININTPVEVYPNFARYTDLEVDVIEKDDKREIIDLEKLDRTVKEGLIKKELADKAIEIANQIIKGEKQW
jgi:Ribonuclease G/E